MAKNSGKIFEDDVKNSIPDNCWLYRLRDNASSFAGGQNTRFASSNICDFILLNDATKTLYLLELKSTKNTSLPLSMIRDNQIKGLQEASKHQLVGGLIVNFRNECNDTFFIAIDEFVHMIDTLNKKSFNISDLQSYNAIKIGCEKKRTRYKYNVEEFCNSVHL